MELVSYEKSGPIKGICKQNALWGEVKSDIVEKHYYHTPLVYFQKPKWIDDGTFQTIIDSIIVNLPVGFELKHECRVRQRLEI